MTDRSGLGGPDNAAPPMGSPRAARGHSTQDLHGKRPVAAAWTESTAAASLPAPPPVRHCWYDGPHGRQAALLLGWRRVGKGYDGRIAVAMPDSSGWALVEVWVDSAMLAPAR